MEPRAEASPSTDLRASLRGVMVPLVTPFTESLAIDWPAFEHHVTWLLNCGLRVLIPADLVGESWALTMEEKALLFRRTVEVAAGRALVIAKLSESSPQQVAQLARLARDASVDAIKVTPPTGADGAAAHEHVHRAQQEAGLPFLLEISHGQASPRLIGRLLDRPEFVAIEEAGFDPSVFSDLVDDYGERLPIIAGAEDVLACTLLLGAAGLMTATPNFAPAFMSTLWSAAAAADAPRTWGLFRRLRRYRRLFSAGLRSGQPLFVTYTKAALGLCGHPVGLPRPPLQGLTDEETALLRTALQEALELDLPTGGSSC